METAAALQKINIAPVDYSYRMPVEFFGKFDKTTGKRLTPKIGTCGQLKWLSDVFSFSVFKDGKRGVCTRTTEQFKRDINVSESTVYRARNAYVGGYVISEAKGKYQFDTDNNTLSGGHYKLEAWMTRPIPHNGGVVEFTGATQLVAAYFNSECNRKPQELSVRDIAYKLDISEPSVQQALNVLTAHQKKNPFVYCVEKGVNGHRKSRYIINRKLFRELGKAEAKRQKAKEKNRAKATEDSTKPDTAFSDAVERELNERRQYRIDGAARALSRALADEEFRTSDEALKRLAPKLAYAEIRKSQDLPTLRRKEKELTAHRRTALKRLGIAEAELSEEFYYKCTKCRDKLFLANGKRCGCFAPGAPPLKAVVGVGEPNMKD